MSPSGDKKGNKLASVARLRGRAPSGEVASPEAMTERVSSPGEPASRRRHLPERLRPARPPPPLFSICSKSSQRNSIFVRYNRVTAREERQTAGHLLPEQASPLQADVKSSWRTCQLPYKHCPPPMRGNSQRRRTDYQTSPGSRNVRSSLYAGSAAFSSFPRRCLLLFCGIPPKKAPRSPCRMPRGFLGYRDRVSCAFSPAHSPGPRRRRPGPGPAPPPPAHRWGNGRTDTAG